MYRIGNGIDIHQFVEGRKLFLGGVEIPYEFGLLGHSDADALLHAVCDAMLGALALGDIGKHFPDTSADYKDIDSKVLLKHVFKLIESKGYEVVNVDCTLLLERPKIAPYIDAMQKTIGDIINLETDAVSVKATTSEKLGFVGRKEGVLASAVVLLKKREQ